MEVCSSMKMGAAGASHLGTGDHGPKTDRSRSRLVPVNALASGNGSFERIVDYSVERCGSIVSRTTLPIACDPTGIRACTPTTADREGRPIASRSDRRTSGLIERLLGARDLGDETGNQALDLGRWQVVAGIAVRQAHIAANHEGAQARLGEALCLCDAEAADHLHRGDLADPFEDGASHIAEVVVLDKFRA